MKDLSIDCKHELNAVLNKYGVDDMAGIADYILTDHIARCLASLVQMEDERRVYEGYSPPPVPSTKPVE